MKEIEFKAKKLGSNEWVNGSLLIIKGSYFIVPFNSSSALQHFQVDPKTVCQYICKKDEKGNKIFSGDVVQYDTEDGIVKASIAYDKDNTVFFYIVIKVTPYKKKQQPVGFLVIGNIYDKN